LAENGALTHRPPGGSTGPPNETSER
jgi:hypothetical protein